MSTKINKDYFWTEVAKLLEEQWQVDIRLKAGDGDDDEGPAIYAHKLILALKSEVFKKMLESDEVKTSKDKIETITLSEMKHEELEALVEFFYSDGSTLSAKGKKHARSLYVAADKYVIFYLRDLCRIELITSLNWGNALDILELSQIPFDQCLSDAAFRTIRSNISIIVNSTKFELLLIKQPNLVLEILKKYFTTNKRNCRYIRTDMNSQTIKKQCSSELEKVLEEKWNVDIGDGDKDSAHKVILASRSRVFKKILESDEVKTLKEKVVIVNLLDMKLEEIKAL